TISPIVLLLLCFRSLSIQQHAVPTIHHVEMNIKLIDYTHRDVIDHVVEVLGVVVERRDWRKNHDAHTRELQHVFEMDLAERRLAYDQHQLASLFQNHVGCTVDKIVADAVRDGRERAHAARRDHHSHRHERTTRDRSSLCTNTVALRREALYFLQ